MSIPRKIIATTVLLVVVVVGAAVWWVNRDDAPPEADLDTAVAAVQEESTSADDGATTTEAEADADADSAIAGAWTVDTETGEFTFESATGTFVGFRVEEELTTVGATTAVGRTNAVTGEATIEGTTLTAATFEVDLTQITTDISVRDGAVQDALETDAHPTATFTLVDPVELGDAADGESISVTAAGELTLHGVTQPVELAIEGQLVDDTIVLVANTTIDFTDYDVVAPSAPVIASIDPVAVLEAQILLTQ